jgi:hypothetical protein
MTLIERIETYRQMAKEMKQVTADVASVDFTINGQSIQDIQEAAKHYEKDLDESLGCLRLCVSEQGFFVVVRSVPCQIRKTVEVIETIAA